MSPYIAYAATFFACYFTVMLVGLNSKILRDDRVLSAFAVSWGITLAQTATTYIIVYVDLPLTHYLWWAGWGGSLGIVSSHYLYKHLTKKESK